MTLTLGELLALPRLGLRLRCGEAALDRPVTWVHATELPAPAPWLEGGEVLLTTGLVPATDPAFDAGAYVRGLVGAGVVALGFGVGVHLDEVPPVLLAAATAHGLPLFEVPAALPFIAVTKAVAARLAQERYAALECALEVQQRMTREGVGTGAAGVLGALLRVLPGWGLVLDPRGRVLAASPADAVQRTGQLWGEISRLGSRAAGRLGLIGNDGADSLVIQSLGASQRSRGYLAVGTPHRLDETARLLVNHAASLLSFELEKSRALRRTERRLGETLLEAFFTGGMAPGQMAPFLELFGFDRDEPLCVLALRPDAPAPALLDLVEEALQDVSGPAMVCRDGEGVAVLLPHPAQAADELAGRVAAGLRAPLSAGVSDAVRPDRLPMALFEARSAAAAGGSGVVPFRALGTTSLLLTLVGSESLDAIVTSLLGPIRDYDARTGAELLRSLATFLRHDARWEEAAAELHIHRHTLRYRLQRIEALTGRNLSSEKNRTEFWLALEAQALLDCARGAPGPRWDSGHAQARPAPSGARPGAALPDQPASAAAPDLHVDVAGPWGRVAVTSGLASGAAPAYRPAAESYPGRP